LTRRRRDGGRRDDATVLNPFGKVETAREDADSLAIVLRSVRDCRCAYVERHHLARLPRVRPIESAMTIDKCDIDASITCG